MVSGGATHTTWPLNEDYCRTMLLLHWPNLFDIQEEKGDAESWIDLRLRTLLLPTSVHFS